ncbi:MAG: DUF6505 family protein [Beijerinckiaceae bacterium]
MKLLRAIRLDPSDTFVFENAAEPGEIIVAGSFAFWHCDAAALTGKQRSAFRGGFLGVTSGGFSTLAQVCEVTEAEKDAACAALASLLMKAFGAPTLEAALPAAQEEIAASAGLADHAPETLIAMHRSIGDDGEITEQFRTLHRRAETDMGLDPKHYRAFTFFESDAADAERVDFDRLMKDKGNA